MQAIDWGAAQRIGELVAGSPPYGGVRASSVEPLAHDFARRVSDYSGLQLPAELPALETVDRPGWIAANLKSMRPLLETLTERIDAPSAGLLSGPLRSASGFLLGAQVGALTGVLSQRVLGQYDLALLDDRVPPRLLLLAPNLALTASNLAVDRDELVLWVTIHEITHAVQFAGAPWLRDHLGGLLRELIDGLQVTIAGRASEQHTDDAAAGNGGGPAGNGAHGPQNGAEEGGRWPKLPDPGELRELVERARRRRASALDARRGPLAAGRAHSGGHVPDRGPRGAHDGRDRSRVAAVAAAPARGAEPPPGGPQPALAGARALPGARDEAASVRGRAAASAMPSSATAARSCWHAYGRGPEALPNSAELQAPEQWIARTRLLI